MPVTDTTAAARRIQLEVHRRMTPAERLQSAIDMSDFAHQLAEAGVRMRHGARPEAEIRRLLVETLYQWRGRGA
jgi:hypothetical protein